MYNFLKISVSSLAVSSALYWHNSKLKAESKLPRVYFILSHQGKLLGRIEMELKADVVPKTAENFRALCTGEYGYGYQNSYIHRIVPGLLIQGGDIDRLGGTSSRSIYNGGRFFQDENFDLKHDKEGVISMANRGPHTNGSQFFITTAPAPWLDGKHVVFGSVVRGMEVVKNIQEIGSEKNVKQKITIADCGDI